MSVGKIAAQVAHASVEASDKARLAKRKWWGAWKKEGQCKVVLTVSSEERLSSIEKDADKLGLPTSSIVDRGLTEIPPDSFTCVGIGPAPSNIIDRVTGKLPLL